VQVPHALRSSSLGVALVRTGTRRGVRGGLYMFKVTSCSPAALRHAMPSAEEREALPLVLAAMKVVLLRTLAPKRVAGLGGLMECQGCGAIGATVGNVRHRNCLWFALSTDASQPFYCPVSRLHVNSRAVSIGTRCNMRLIYDPMKATTFVFLLAVCGTVTRAQNSAAPSADVTIQMSEDTPEYCLGEITSSRLEGPRRRGPDDITLQLPLKVLYQNHRPETIILPSWIHYLTRMTVVGQNGSTVLREMGNGRGMNVNTVISSSPNVQFTIIAGGKDAWSSGNEGVVIPVLDRSSGVDLRGKTLQVVMTRDFRSLTPDGVEKLNEKWKAYGTVWTGVTESETLTLRIPANPPTRSCITLVAR
jgi:hypothetical protein